MYQQAIEAYLKSQHISYKVQGEQIVCRCLNPKHIDSNPSFQFNTEEGYCHCFSCGWKSHISRMADIEIDEDTLRAYDYDKLIEQLKLDSHEISDENVVLPPKAFDIVWPVRHIGAEIMRDLGVYYCEKGRFRGRLIFPITNVDGVLLGYTSWVATAAALGEFKDRLVDAVRPDAKYLHSYKMNTSNLLYPTQCSDMDLKHEQGLHLTEGLFDALSLIQLGYPAVCNFGLGAPSINKVGEMLSMGYEVLVPAFDNDKAGMEGWQKIRDDWAEHVTISAPTQILRDIREYGSKDANEYLTKRLTHD